MELRNKLQILVISVFFLVLFTNKCVLSCHSQIVTHIVEEHKELGCEDNELYFKETDRCYLFNTVSRSENQGPCGNLMFLNRQQENSKLGRCECLSLPGLARPLVYDKRTKQCYFIFSQGPCKGNKHVGVGLNGQPRCVNNPCAREQRQAKTRGDSNQQDFVLYRSACVQLGSRCGINGLISFVESSHLPTCEERITQQPDLHKPKAIGAIGASSCPAGQYPNLTGKCQEPIELDF